MSKNTRDGARIDLLAEGLLRADAEWEMRELMSELTPESLTRTGSTRSNASGRGVETGQTRQAQAAMSRRRNRELLLRLIQ